jgi:hypothetical protein
MFSSCTEHSIGSAYKCNVIFVTAVTLGRILIKSMDTVKVYFIRPKRVSFRAEKVLFSVHTFFKNLAPRHKILYMQLNTEQCV